MADSKEFYIDPRTKLGGEVEWETGDDFNSFVDALNRGAVVRTGSIPSETGTPADIRDDAAAISELRALFARYN